VKTAAGTLTKIKAGGSGYLSQGDPRLTFGLGSQAHAEWVEVTWPGGATQRWERVPARTTLRVREENEAFDVVEERRFSLPDPATADDVRMARLRFGRGDRFPDLALRTLDGEPVRLASLIPPGRRAFVNLWTTFCIPCRREMPELQELRPRLREAGVELVGISLDIDTVDRVPGFLEKLGITYPIVMGGGDSIPQIFSGEEAIIPISFLLDEERRVVKVWEGWTDATRDELLGLLEQKAASREPAPGPAAP